MFVKRKSVLLFLLPGLAMMMVFYVIPFVGGIGYSVTDGSFRNAFIGLDNYKMLWKNEMFLLGLRNSIGLSAICAPLLWASAFLLAVVLEELKNKTSFIRSSMLMPYLMPSSAMLLVWLLLFDYGGPVNRIFAALGIERVYWLEGAALWFPIVLMFMWKNIGFSVIIFSAALQAVPSDYNDYARLDGARLLTRMMHITLPLIAPNAFLVLVLAWINAFKIFKEVYFIAGAYPDFSVYTLQNYMNNMFERIDYQFVTAAAYSFAVLVLILFGVLFVMQRRVGDGLY